MPKWGLTVEQRRSWPWGLPAEILAPGKTITDPIHGDIFLTKLEAWFVDGPPMQRLRRVKQLGTTHLVYPGATHTRFSHSLGALRVAQDLLDYVVDQRNGPDRIPDIFEEWAADRDSYDRRVAEATILARLGALMHDMCHVAFGHSIEDDLGILEAHDENGPRFEQLWSQFDPSLRKMVSGDLESALRVLILSKEERPASTSAAPYAFVADIVGNTICADLLDYLPRDHYYTGLPLALGHRFLTGFYVSRSTDQYHPGRMVIRIKRDGRERADVTSELFKYLRYRYELSERALVHHGKLAADAMIGKMLEMWKDSLWIDEAARRYPAQVKVPVSDIDSLRADLMKTIRVAPEASLKAVDEAVQRAIENEFMRHGDDGLLEKLLELTEARQTADRRMSAIAGLAAALLDRRLFKLAAQCRSARPKAEVILEKHGTPSARRQLEHAVTSYAGLAHRQVVLWIPPPKMRMKAAGVLVDDGVNISTLYDLDRSLRHRGREIYESHEWLWAISAFVDPEVSSEQVKVVLAFLAEKISIQWDGHEHETTNLVAAEMVARELNVPHDVEVELRAENAAYHGGDTFADVLEQKRSIARSSIESTAPQRQEQDSAQSNLPFVAPTTTRPPATDPNEKK